LNHNTRIHVAAAAIALATAAGCGGSTENQAEADKKAFEAASSALKKPVGLIAAYLPHLGPPDTKDKYAAKRRPDHERATHCAANEIRHAANGARQVLQRAGTATKDLQTALTTIAITCADAQDPAALDKCSATVRALDDALQKSEAASAAAGVAAKLPRVTPEAITEDTKTAIAPFLKVRGPGQADVAYMAKRADPSAPVADVIAACQTALGEAEEVARVYEKAEEPLRLIAVTRKMSMDSQCNALNAVDTLRKELEACRKKPKSTECTIACAKAKTIIDDGVPAATFEPLATEHTEICEKK
jgi:hypothetical protein